MELKEKIHEMVKVCNAMPYFRSAIFVATKEEQDQIYDALVSIVKEYDFKGMRCIRFENTVVFNNGSSICVRTGAASSRIRFHKIICSYSLKDAEWFNRIVYSLVSPYYFHESVEFTNLDGEI